MEFCEQVASYMPLKMGYRLEDYHTYLTYFDVLKMAVVDRKGHLERLMLHVVVWTFFESGFPRFLSIWFDVYNFFGL